MNTHKITVFTRILMFVCGLALITVLFTPIWRIDLQAPQYPEGLKMFIHANKLSGDVTIINGLNHYIGMKTLDSDDFTEFKILPGIILVFSALFLITGFADRRGWMNLLCVLFVAFGILAMVDFWRWEYDYGHNLNPNAAIIVPGMAYQPPLIGFKQLLNFGAYSVPATGGWIFVAVGSILLASVIYEWRRARKKIVLPVGVRGLAMGMISMIIFTGCNTEPQAIYIGKDNCEFCKMMISDSRFGAEIVTTKSKVYKFDDAHCILAFVKSNKIIQTEIAGVYFTNFNTPHELIRSDKAYLLQSPHLKSPMNGNIAAFTSEDNLISMLPRLEGNKISWEDLQ